MVQHKNLPLFFNIETQHSRFIDIALDKLEFNNLTILKKEVNNKQIITEIRHSSGFSLKLTDKLIINNELYEINKIAQVLTEEKNKFIFRLTDSKINKCSQFILPLLGLSRKDIGIDSLLINSFIGYYNKNYGKYIYLLYRIGDSDKFEEIENSLVDLNLDVKTIFSNKYLCLLRLELPQLFSTDIKTLLKGKYSKISDAAKFVILKYYNAKKDSEMYNILNKARARRLKIEENIGSKLNKDAELYSAFDELDIFYEKV